MYVPGTRSPARRNPQTSHPGRARTRSPSSPLSDLTHRRTAADNTADLHRYPARTMDPKQSPGNPHSLRTEGRPLTEVHLELSESNPYQLSLVCRFHTDADWQDLLPSHRLQLRQHLRDVVLSCIPREFFTNVRPRGHPPTRAPRPTHLALTQPFRTDRDAMGDARDRPAPFYRNNSPRSTRISSPRDRRVYL